MIYQCDCGGSFDEHGLCFECDTPAPITRNIKKIILIAALLMFAGCEPKPTPFEEGAEVAPPRGCVEGRERGVDC